MICLAAPLSLQVHFAKMLATVLQAKHSAAHCSFDETATIRCEVARKNMYLKDDHTTKRGRFDTGTGSASGSGFPAYPTGAGGFYPPAAAATPPPAGPRQYAQSEQQPCRRPA